MTETGPLAEEAAKFLSAATDWLNRGVLDPATARIATGSPECAWCPLCQLIAALRGERPELAERWGELQVQLLSLLHAVTDSRPGPSAPAPTPADGPRLQHIDLSGADRAESTGPEEG